MPSYSLAPEFLQRIYNADELKIVRHHQAQLILRIIAASVDGRLDYDVIYGFIEGHGPLKTLVNSLQPLHTILKWNIRRLVRIGVLIAA